MESIENLTRFVRGKVFNCVVRRLDERWHCAVFIRVFIAASFKGIFGVTNPRYNKRIKRTGLRKHDFATWKLWTRMGPESARCWQHRADSGPLLGIYGMFTGYTQNPWAWPESCPFQDRIGPILVTFWHIMACLLHGESPPFYCRIVYTRYIGDNQLMEAWWRISVFLCE